jgi:ABC-type transport system substrate-binding protein
VSLAAAVLAAGCTQTPVVATRDPITLRFGVASPKTSLTSSGVRGFIGNLLQEPLIGMGWDGRPYARIATPAVSADGLTLDLQLRDNLQFHDGTPVDARYIKADLERIFKDSSYDSYRSVVAVQAVENNLVRVTLARREALMLSDLSNASVTHNKDPDIGLGPFKLITRTPMTRLAAFDRYYRGRPSVDFVEISEYEEQRTAWAAFMRDQIDAVHEISPEVVEFIGGQGGAARKFEFTGPYYIMLLFNVRSSILKSAAVRQALSYAVDRQAIIDDSLNNQGVVAEGPIWPFHWAYSTAQKTYNHNSEAATIHLDSAGFPMKPARKLGQMPGRFTLRCLTIAREARFEKIALVLQKQLYDVGIDLQIEALPADEAFKRFGTGDFDTFLVQRASGRSLGWTYSTFYSTKIPIGYSAADKVLERLRSTTTDAEVIAAVSDLQQVFHDDPPAIFIAWPKVTRAVSAKFEVREESGRDILGTLPQWRLAEPRR